MRSATVQIRQRGTLTLPAKLRTKYQLDDGDSLTLVDLDSGILLSPKVQVVPKLAAEIERIRRSLGLELEDLLSSGRRRRAKRGRPAKRT
jgi:bifunctional DNA-binding transcriptional regulator/antitoxin component of YhaV-PrlF toxin-antitoxin module